ncbi:MAG: adenylyltransferase/cytidyltransferase family protein [Candidatus Omnitrophica bacterium]|nr:adenylyltransferase/cytidyltransferase family protein [Candidatus Omnitrophota bacterium]
MSKVYPLDVLQKEIARQRTQGRTVVFTNGCFDLLHPGHIKILEYAKSKGDHLVVGLNSDTSIRTLKGPSRPVLPQTARGRILSAIEYVDYIVIFEEETPYRIIETLKPDYLVKGGDWNQEKIVGRDLVKEVFRVPLEEGFSTSAIIDTICHRHG